MSSSNSLIDVIVSQLSPFPVKLLCNDDRGRYLVAERDLEPGEVVCCASILFGTITEHLKTTVCAYCFNQFQKRLTLTCQTCCEIYYCSNECLAKSEHNHVECELLKKLRKIARELTSDEYSTLRAIIRLISMHLTENTLNIDPLYDFLVSNKQLAHKENLQWYTSQAELLQKILRDFAIPVSTSYLLDLLYKLNCNCFGIWSKRGSQCMATGIFISASFFNHQCYPNCRHVFENQNNREIKIKTLYHVPAGTELCIPYINIWQNQSLRRLELKNAYFFDCRCLRCLDERGYYDERLEVLACKRKNCTGLMVPCFVGGKERICSKCKVKRKDKSFS
eukprot:TRINITY_DN13941_c0_g1_i1.p1 TRINITY_DN13941_c0_g1~~TRINITY_DN13941_c0_g1_i1.p1  ORF type:complete len:336 (+),score=18.90 TRINITY_DN13941_c0_g1_i1:32-1039(+)